MATAAGEFDKLKKKRSVFRSLITKLINKIEEIVREESDAPVKDKIANLQELYDQLVEKSDSLKGINNEIEKYVSVDELENEILVEQEYCEKITIWKRRLNNKINDLTQNLNVLVASTELQQGSSHGQRNDSRSIKLPKLSIRPYNGDPLFWLEFWHQYEGAIHLNDALTDVEKFNYLKTLCVGAAFNAISGLSLTDENYKHAIEILKDRFGRSDLIVNAHMNRLLNLDPVRNSSNVVALRKMFEILEINIRSLETLNVTSGSYGQLLCPILIKLLPEDIALDYNRKRKSRSEFDVSELLEFVKGEIECRETSSFLNSKKSSHPVSITPGIPNYPKKPYAGKRNTRFTQNPTASVLSAQVGENCIFCLDKMHEAEKCPLSISERKNSLKSQARCFICMNRRHKASFCFKRNQLCKLCKQPHNYLICDSQSPGKNGDSQNSVNIEKKKDDTVLSTISSVHCGETNDESSKSVPSNVYLQTFCALIKCGNVSRKVRVLIDGGSNKTFIRKDVARSLGLKIVKREEFSIYAFGAVTSQPRQIYEVAELQLFSSVYSQLSIKLEAIIVNDITQGHIEIPSQWIKNIAVQKGIKLADYRTSKEIHVLIGSDYMWEILYDQNIRIGKRLMLTDSMFGFIVQGREMDSDKSCKNVCVNHVALINGEIDSEIVRNLWELEAIGINPGKEISLAEKDVLDAFDRNTVYRDNRYETCLLWKENCEGLNTNYGNAERRLISLNNKFKRTPKLFQRYSEILNEQLRDGIIEQVKMPLDEGKYIGYFMPHHAVVNESKESTKVRIVFDASSKVKDELSLNDCLHSGPNLNPDLLRIILRFRFHPIAFCADIQRAFLEVGIAEPDRKFLQFLWINEKGANLDFHGRDFKILRYTKAPFGVKCSSFLLTATIRKHLNDYESSHRETCEMLKELYVDDLISGAESIEKAASLSKTATYILREASMNLRRWSSNSPELIQIWNNENLECRQDTNVPLKILGLIWDNVQDTITVELDQLIKIGTNVTKRKVLAACGLLFDPIGLLEPFKVRVKVLMQILWEKGLQWDESLPTDLEITFLEWVNEVTELKRFEIPRPYFQGVVMNYIEVHIFSDASLKAYGSVVYFRIKVRDKWTTSFVMSKSRLAPLRKITLPRLELLGALISARLASYLTATFPILRAKNTFFWTDSQICLHWIKGNSDNWKQFVQNRVIEIKEKTDPMNWFFCTGKENPADKVTRGMKATNLVKDDLWWRGPKWLMEERNLWPKIKNCVPPELDEEIRKECKSVVQNSCLVEPKEDIIDITKYSDLHRILRITAWILRFINNARVGREKLRGELSADELNAAEVFWIKNEQLKYFPDESKWLKKGEPISASSKIYPFNPFLESDVIRVGGRLQHAELSFSEKHPIILPEASHLTELIIKKNHERVGHSGVEDTLIQTREKYWIPRGRQRVKRTLHRCMICRRFRVKAMVQNIAPLPTDRVNETLAFEVTGIDFAGPLYTKDQGKSYIALFTCATTRALHLELVSDLSASKFLLAFKRFVSRRGLVRTVYSDNAKTFKKSDSDLKKLWSAIKDPEVLDYFGHQGITWKYIVERAAWWGGFWERMVKMTKNCLRKILGRASLSFEELQTTLTEVEAIINSRPLTYVDNDPFGPSPLTPSHFLVGKRLTSLPYHAGRNDKLASNKQILIKRYLYREKLLNLIWCRWKKEYLLLLKHAHYSKPLNVKDLNVNDVVLVGEEKVPRHLWKMAKIVETHKGRDGKTRSATLKTPKGIIKRPIQLLYHLELENK